MAGTYIRTFLSQFSLVDLRPLYTMAGVCQKHDLKLLTYGTLVNDTSVGDYLRLLS